MSAPRQAVIIAAKRTAFGKIGGMFRSRSALQLAGPVLRSLHRPFVAAGESVDEVLMGNVLAGGNVARGAALEAGLSVSCPALTLDRQCSSGLDAIVDAAWRIQAGAADRLLAGGVESSSTAPWRLEQPRSAREMPRVVSQAPFTGGGMADPTMIEGAEAAARWGAVSRDDQDKLALRSHAKALQAQADGLFAPELVSVFGQDPETDEGPKAGLTAARLARLTPLTGPDGSVTIGNSCDKNDGSAAVAIVERQVARRMGATQGLVFLQAAAAGDDPAAPGLAAIAAGRALIQRHWALRGAEADSLPDEITAIEFNEAFAGQTLACLRSLGLSDDDPRVCRKGGALALGHPYGASGAALVVRLFHECAQAGREGALVLALLGVAGGQGVAALFRWQRL